MFYAFIFVFKNKQLNIDIHTYKNIVYFTPLFKQKNSKKKYNAIKSNCQIKMYCKQRLIEMSNYDLNLKTLTVDNVQTLTRFIQEKVVFKFD